MDTGHSSTAQPSPNDDRSSVDCFAYATQLAMAGDTSYRKRYLGVMTALTGHDVQLFAEEYATHLQKLNLISSTKVTRITWQDLTKDTHMPGLAFHDVFNKAAGGVLLIEDTYKDYQTLDARVVNYKADQILFYQVDKCAFDDVARTFRESAEKPVVILSGRAAALRSTIETDSGFDSRFVQRVGI